MSAAELLCFVSFGLDDQREIRLERSSAGVFTLRTWLRLANGHWVSTRHGLRIPKLAMLELGQAMLREAGRRRHSEAALRRGWWRGAA